VGANGLRGGGTEASGRTKHKRGNKKPVVERTSYRPKEKKRVGSVLGMVGDKKKKKRVLGGEKTRKKRERSLNGEEGGAHSLRVIKPVEFGRTHQTEEKSGWGKKA